MRGAIATLQTSSNANCNAADIKKRNCNAADIKLTSNILLLIRRIIIEKKLDTRFLLKSLRNRNNLRVKVT